MNHRLGLSCATVLALIGCSGSSDPTTTPGAKDTSVALAQSDIARVAADAVPADALAATVAANNAFAVDLYGQVRKTTPSGNLLTSPISATLALTMSFAGAKGQTATEMAKALHLSGGDPDFAGQNALSQALNARASAALSHSTLRASQGGAPAPSADDFQLEVVNSVWGQTAYPWEKPFLDIMAAQYGAGVNQLNFAQAPEPARLTINAWVSDETKAKINDLLPQGSIDTQTRLVLVNALHLKLPWETPFSAQNTQPGNFTRSDSSSVATSFMNRHDRLAYVDDGQAQTVALPLGGLELAVLISVPHENVALADYEATLAANSAALQVPSTYSEVDLSLPKAAFTSHTFSLSSALRALGMNQAFDPEQANFKGLCAAPPNGENLYISDVLQKTMIAMQEEGVEAAAATAVVFAGSSAAMATPVSMVVNRPYLVSIVDVPTGAVLMLGHINDPSDAGGP